MAVTGKGDFPLRSIWVNPYLLYRRHSFANSEIASKTVMQDWFFDAVVSPPAQSNTRSLLRVGT